VGQLKLRVDTSKLRVETITKYATVTCNDPKNPQVRLNFGGKVRQIARLNPVTLNLKGLAGSDLRASLNVTPGTEISFEVIEATPLRRQFEVIDTVTLADGNSFRIDIGSRPALVPGALRDTLQLTLACSDGEIRTTTIPVTINHMAPISVVPRGNVVFQRRDTDRLKNPTGPPVQRDVQIFASDPSITFNITGMRFEDAPEGLFSHELRTVRQGSRYAVKIRVLESRQERSIRSRLVVETDHPEMLEIPIRLYAQFGPVTPIRPQPPRRVGGTTGLTPTGKKFPPAVKKVAVPTRPGATPTPGKPQLLPPKPKPGN